MRHTFLEMNKSIQDTAQRYVQYVEGTPEAGHIRFPMRRLSWQQGWLRVRLHEVARHTEIDRSKIWAQLQRQTQCHLSKMMRTRFAR